MSRSSAKPKAVADTNLFVSSAISPLGLPAKMLDARRERRFRLLLSERQLVKVAEVFGRPSIARRFRLSRERLAEMVAGLAAAETAPLRPDLPIDVRDPNDEHILAAALGGGADYLVTGDDDLFSLAGDPRLGALQIVTVVAFPTLLGDPDREADARPSGSAAGRRRPDGHERRSVASVRTLWHGFCVAASSMALGRPGDRIDPREETAPCR